MTVDKSIKTVQLADIADVSSGQSAPQDTCAFSTDGIPFIRAGSLETLTNGGSENDCEKIKKSVGEGYRLRLFPKDTILFAKSGMSATLGRIYRLRQPCYVVSHLATVIPGNEVCSSYLQRWFEINPPSRLIPNEAYPSIRVSEIEKLKIPLPTLPEQKRISKILDQADAIRHKRRQAIQTTDDLIPAIFHKIFGDISDHGSYTVRPLEACAEIVSGVTKGRKFNEQKTVMLPYLRVANVQDGHLDLNEIKTIEALPSDLEKCRLQSGDLLLTEGGDYDKLGRGAMWEGQIEDCIHQNHIFRVRVDKDILLPVYFKHYLQTSSVKAYFLRCAKKTTNLASMNMTQLKALPVAVPPMSIQKEFAKATAIAQSIIEKNKTSGLLAENVFNAVIQRAFRGEL